MKIQDEKNRLEIKWNLDMQLAFREGINYKSVFATTLLIINLHMAHRHILYNIPNNNPLIIT